MTGRVTSENAPAYNAHGVAYRDLLMAEKARNERMEGRLWSVIGHVEEALALNPNSRRRRYLFSVVSNLIQKLRS